MARTSFVRLDSGTILETKDVSLWREATVLPRAEGARLMRAEAIAELRKSIAPGATIYCVLRNVSRSGMQRKIDLYTIENNQLSYLSGYAARALGDPMPDDGIKVNGCGMDMGFHLVYSLSRTLFPDGFAPSTKARRPSTHGEKIVDVNVGRKGAPVTREWIAKKHAEGWQFTGGRNGDASGWDSDGGYALKHKWI